MENKPSPRHVLSPYHFGVALVASLLSDTDLRRVPVHPLSARAAGTMLSDAFGVSAYADAARVHTSLHGPADPSSSSSDPELRLDVALLFEDRALALEVELCQTPISPSEFRSKFLGGAPHRTRLELDRSAQAAEEPAAELSVEGKPVVPGWLLVVGCDTWLGWKDTRDLAADLGFRQLAGVLVFEEIIEAIGAYQAREIALTLARRSIKSWFAEHTKLE